MIFQLIWYRLLILIRPFDLFDNVKGVCERKSSFYHVLVVVWWKSEFQPKLPPGFYFWSESTIRASINAAGVRVEVCVHNCLICEQKPAKIEPFWALIELAGILFVDRKLEFQNPATKSGWVLIFPAMFLDKPSFNPFSPNLFDRKLFVDFVLNLNRNPNYFTNYN